MKHLLVFTMLFANVFFPAEETTNEEQPVTNPITVTQTQYSIEEFSSTNISYTVTPGVDAVVTFASSNNQVASVNDMGVVSALTPGEATITLTAKVGESSFDTPIKVSVYSITGTLSFKYNSVYVHRGTSYQLEYTLSNPLLENKDIVWVSSDPSVVEVANGVVRGISKGSATVTATLGDVSSSIHVDVIVPLQEIAFNPESISITLDESESIPELIFVPYDTSNKHDAVYEITDTSIIEIKDGQIVAKRIGKTTLRAIIDDVVATLDVEVLPKVSDAGAVIATLVPIDETNTYVKFGFAESSLSATKRVALTLDNDSLKKAISEGKAIVVSVPQRYFDEDMRFVECITVMKESLEGHQGLTHFSLVNEDNQETKITFTVENELADNLNLKYRIQKIVNSSPFAKMVDGRAFEVRFFNDTSLKNVSAKISASEIDSTPQQMHFLYTIEKDNRLSDVTQSNKVGDDATLEINVDSDHYLLTFNAVSKSSDQGVIWALAAVVVIILLSGGVIYYNGKRKSKKDVL